MQYCSLYLSLLLRVLLDVYVPVMCMKTESENEKERFLKHHILTALQNFVSRKDDNSFRRLQ